jgi:hypothetical protein
LCRGTGTRRRRSEGFKEATSTQRAELGELRGCNGRMEQRKGGDFFTLERPEGEGRGAGQLGQEGQGRWWAQDRPGQAVAMDGWRAYA